MTGTLLGGFRIWLQDGSGFPLSAPGGRASFYKAGTSVPSSEPLEVYNSADMDVPLGTVVYTDANGYLPDIWLRSDYLYDVVVERKLQDDPETWETLYEVKNVGRIINEQAESYFENSTIVDNISALRVVDINKFSRVYVAGYYKPNDWGEPSLFVYDSTSTKAIDGGKYILPSSIPSPVNPGRWVQQFSGDIIDVRKYGAIPDLDGDEQDTVSKIVNCITYCNSATEHKRALTVGFLAPGNYYISGKLDMSYYKFGSYYTHFVINDGVVFNGYLESASVVTLGANTDCESESALVAGNATLEVPAYMTRVDTRWFGNSESPVSNGVVYRYSGKALSGSSTFFEFNMVNGTFRSERLDVDNLIIDNNTISYLNGNQELVSLIETSETEMKFGVQAQFDGYAIFNKALRTYEDFNFFYNDDQAETYFTNISCDGLEIVNGSNTTKVFASSISTPHITISGALDAKTGVSTLYDVRASALSVTGKASVKSLRVGYHKVIGDLDDVEDFFLNLDPDDYGVGALLPVYYDATMNSDSDPFYLPFGTDSKKQFKFTEGHAGLLVCVGTCSYNGNTIPQWLPVGGIEKVG